jgi:hypothetical protein
VLDVQVLRGRQALEEIQRLVQPGVHRPDTNQPIQLRKREGPEDRAIDNGIEQRVGADAERERKHDDG